MILNLGLTEDRTVVMVRIFLRSFPVTVRFGLGCLLTCHPISQILYKFSIGHNMVGGHVRLHKGYPTFINTFLGPVRIIVVVEVGDQGVKWHWNVGRTSLKEKYNFK